MDAGFVVPILALLGVVGAAIITQRSAKTTGEVWKDLNGDLRQDRDDARKDAAYWKKRALAAEAKLDGEAE